MGLSAALLAASRGYDATLFEKEDVGASLTRWGPVRFFTPLGMNLPSQAGRLAQLTLPAEEELLTGPEMVERILIPMARSPLLEGRVMTRHRVVAVGRAGMTRGERPGHPLRAERPFHIVVSSPSGERIVQADAVLDASGVYDTPARTGQGGLPAVGEAEAEERIIRRLGALASRRVELKGATVLMVGQGHSAANALLLLEQAAAEAPATRVVWAVRGAHARPCEEIAEDPLPERRRVASRANDLAQAPPAWLSVKRRCAVEAIAPHEKRLAVRLTDGGSVACDTIVSMTGYRPDLSFLSELALEISPATEGAGRLARALSGSSDCLSVPRVRPEDLASGEPGFHLIGAKSYGRARTFLLRTGLQQLETILEGLGR